MYGWILDCLEKLLLEKYGIDTHTQIFIEADTDVPEDGFDLMHDYPENIFFDLVAAAGSVLQLSRDEIVIIFGEYWIPYVKSKGFGKLLRVLGDNLRDVSTPCVTNRDKDLHLSIFALLTLFARPLPGIF